MRAARALLAAAALAAAAVVWSGPAAAQEASGPPTATTTPTTAPAPTPPAPDDDPLGTTPTATTTPPPSAAPDGDDDPGFFDVAGRVRKAVNDWFADLVNGAVQPVFDLIGDRVLSTPDFTGDARVRDLWTASWAVANTIFVLFVVAAGVIGMAHETVQTRYQVKELLPRLFVGWVAANASLVLARVAIGFANAVSEAFVADGIGFEGVGSVLKLAVSGAMVGAPLFVVLIALVAVVLGLCLACVGIVRVCTVVVLVAAAPLFLIGYALPQTEGAARLWWRALMGCLAVQVGQAVVITTAVRVFFAAPEGGILGLPHSALMDLLIVTCLLWLALRIPSYARNLVFAARPNAAVSVVKYQVVGRAVRGATKAAKTALAAAA
jgi:hypothetical protein